MFIIASLEVEGNLRMSKIIAKGDSVNEMDKEIDLVEKHEQKETFSLHFKPSFIKQKDDYSSDVREERYTILFSEDCNQPVNNSIKNGCK